MRNAARNVTDSKWGRRVETMQIASEVRILAASPEALNAN
jgi:hypothetical protein